MPRRSLVFADNEIYHIYNRNPKGIASFRENQNKARALELIRYYHLANVPFSFSQLRKRKDYSKELRELEAKKQFKVDILAFCIMDNHFHLLVRQLANNGISQFISDFSNGYTRYFNILNNRKGPLFESVFKATHIESEEQLVHVSRYIHLNPYSAAAVKEIVDLKTYPWTSLPEYLQSSRAVITDPKAILVYFHNDPQEYWQFVNDRADYQRELEEIKHLLEE